MDTHEWPYRLKSVRRKKRLVKEHRDKQLIQLDKLQGSLIYQKRHLPMIRLEQPYQKGWKRFFILRKDIAESDKAEFYQNLLNKINTVRYHHDKTFKRRKRRISRYNYVERPQTLQEISEYDWWRNKPGLSDEEKEHFYRKEEWRVDNKKITVTYVFKDAWRFVLVVRPHIIYEVKMIDEVLEQELSFIDRKIKTKYLWLRIRRLTTGRSNHRWDFIDKPKYINKLKNKPKYADKQAYQELET